MSLKTGGGLSCHIVFYSLVHFLPLDPGSFLKKKKKKRSESSSPTVNANLKEERVSSLSHLSLSVIIMTRLLVAELNVVNEESIVKMFTGGGKSCSSPVQRGHCQAEPGQSAQCLWQKWAGSPSGLSTPTVES